MQHQHSIDTFVLICYVIIIYNLSVYDTSGFIISPFCFDFPELVIPGVPVATVQYVQHCKYNTQCLVQPTNLSS